MTFLLWRGVDTDTKQARAACSLRATDEPRLSPCLVEPFKFAHE
jgi:hypothetical protein